MDGQLVREKIAQAKAILEELDLDLWLLAGRETGEMPDPAFRWSSGRVLPGRVCS